MKWNNVLVMLLLLPLLVTHQPQPAQAWSYASHRETTVEGFALLPEPWTSIFSELETQLIEASVAPDMVRSSDVTEPPRHYDDSDIPHKDRNVPFPSENYSLGVVSWAVENSTRDMRNAIERRDFLDIIRYSGDVAHYVADAAQPFHATANYDGQLTGNYGIHSRFETSLVERYFDEIYNFTPEDFVSPSIVDPYDMTEAMIDSGLQLVPSILQADDVAKEQSEGQYDSAYYAKLYELTGDIVRQRLKLAIQNIANAWYTAITTVEMKGSDLFAFSSVPNNTVITTDVFTVNMYGYHLESEDSVRIYLEGEEDQAKVYSPQGAKAVELSGLSEGDNEIVTEYLNDGMVVHTSRNFLTVDSTPPVLDLVITNLGGAEGGERFHIVLYSNEPLEIAKFYVDKERELGLNDSQIILDAGTHELKVIARDINGLEVEITETIVAERTLSVPWFFLFGTLILVQIRRMRKTVKL